MRGRYLVIIVFALILASANVAVLAQGKKKPSPKSQSKLADELEKSRAEVVNAANEYKSSLEKLLVLLESDIKRASEKAEQRKELLAQGIISRRELEESERELSESQQKADDTRKQMVETDHLIAEASAIVDLTPVPTGSYRATSAIIRYNGPAGWSIAQVGKVDGFFVLKFGRSLPISALGQSATHDRLGYDHRNNVDVALHPDSAEGQTLMDYLRGVGIPFIAFRQAVAGSATGAHIHIGYPSHRLAR